MENRSPILILSLTLYYLALLVAAVVITSQDSATTGMVAIAIILALAPISILLASHTNTSEAPNSEFAREIRHMATSIETLTQESGLSEAAKRVLHRRQERDLLCKAIEQDIADKDWNAAMILVKELAERFGYHADAESFRTRIERARAETLSSEVESATARLKSMIQYQQWNDAFAEAASIQRLFPDSPRVDGLHQLVATAKEKFKLNLEREFLEAAQREESTKAMELLRTLDSYLTESEAEHFREVARGVIGKAKDNLGVRFKLLVQDKSWDKALDVAEEILVEFPNSKMAEELRDMIDVLRANAAQMSRIQPSL